MDKPMETQDKKVISAKATRLESLMKNEKLSKVIADAWDAPPGSTKREKARAMLKSLDKAQKNFYGYQDGMGGAVTDPNQQYAMAQTQQSAANQQPSSELTATSVKPEDMKPSPTKIMTGVSPQESPMSLSDTGEGLVGGEKPASLLKDTTSWTDKLSTWLFDDTDKLTNPDDLYRQQYPNAQFMVDPSQRPADLSKMREAGYQGVMSQTGEMLYGDDTLLGSVRKDPYVPYKDPSGLPSPLQDTGYQPSPKTSVDTTLQLSPQARANQKVADAIKDAEAAAAEATSGVEGAEGVEIDPEVVADAAKAAAQDAVDSGLPAPLTPDTMSDFGDQASSEGVQTLMDSYGEDAVDAWYNGLDSSAKDYYKEVYDAVKGGMGNATWTRRAIANKDLLSKLMGVPQEALTGFPENGLIESHIFDLSKLKKKEMGLYQMEYELSQKRKVGAALEDNIASYIRGKDEYLTNIERLQFETREAVAMMDTSNPHVAKRMKNYQNYLTILHGRQNQRYIDFMKSSVTQFNAEMTSLKEDYNAAYNRYKEEFTEEAVRTREQFEATKEILSDLYSNVESREQKYRDKLTWEMSILQSQANLVKTITDNSTTDFGFDQGTYDKIAKVGKNGLIEGALQSPLDLYSKAVMNDEDPGMYLDEYATTAKESIRYKIAGGNIMDAVDELAESLDFEDTGDDKIDSALSNYRTSMQNTLFSEIKKYLMEEDNLTSVLDVVKNLANKGWIRNWGTSEKDKQDFVSQHMGTVDKRVLEALFDMYAVQVNDGLPPGDTFSLQGTDLWDLPAEQAANALSGIISAS